MSSASLSLQSAEQFKYAATESGDRLLQDMPMLSAVASKFCISATVSETFLESYPFIGSGDNSAVWSVEGVAVKISTLSTGRDAWVSSRSTKPENLIDQLEFLAAYRAHLRDTSDGSVTVPEQYFALQNSKGDYLRTEEHMKGWISLIKFCCDRGLDVPESKKVLASARGRIAQSVGDSIFRLGLDDIGIRGGGPVNGSNILVPEASDNPTTAQLCIIDQPKRGIKGKLTMPFLRHSTKGVEILR